MNTIVISIEHDGTSRFLLNDRTAPFLEDDAIVRRASHVEPESVILRLLFHTLRSVFGEYGWVSDFTRQWKCNWRVNLKPSGGPILKTRWTDRKQAIDAEIDWLNEHFI
jgi:hypothetical protein